MGLMNAKPMKVPKAVSTSIGSKYKNVSCVIGETGFKNTHTREEA